MDTVTEEKVDIGPHMDVVVRPVMAVHRIYADYVPYEDLLSEAYVWWYGPGQPHLEKYLSEEDEGRVALRRSIWRWCQRYAEKEKAHASGYEPIDQVTYSPREILAVLPVALNPEGVPGRGAVQEGPSAKGNLAEGGSLLASLVDVRRALTSLHEDDLQFLYLAEEARYDWDKLVEHIGSEVLADTLRRRHARIVARLGRFLNSYNDKDNA